MVNVSITKEEIDKFLKENARKMYQPEYYFGLDTNQDPPENFDKAKLRVFVGFLSPGDNRGVANTMAALNWLLKEKSGDDVFVDYCYYLSAENQELFEKNGIPYEFGCGSHRPIRDFDIFILSSAICTECLNIPHLLEGMGIPLTIQERDKDNTLPPIFYGGAAANEQGIILGPIYNKDGSVRGKSLIDMACYGYGERMLPVLSEALIKYKSEGNSTKDKPKLKEWLIANNVLHDIIFYPEHYEWVYDEKDKFTIKEIKKLDPRLPDRVRYNQIRWTDFEGFPKKIFNVSGENADSHDVMISSGCSGSSSTCSFCMEATVAGYYRERSLDDVVKSMKEVRGWAACNNLSHYSYNMNYYGRFGDLLVETAKIFKHTSLRNERMDVVANAPEQLTLAKRMGLQRFSGAIEGMGDRIRNGLLNKNLPRETLVKACRVIFSLKLMHLKCLVPETKVYTKSGVLPLGSVVEGEQIWDGEGWTKVVKTGLNTPQPVIKMTLHNGLSVTGLPDHKVLTSEGWKELGKVVLGDKVQLNSTPVNYSRDSAETRSFKVDDYRGRNYWQVKFLSSDHLDADEELGFVVGWISGDGHIRKNRCGITLIFSDDEVSVWKRIESILDKWGVTHSEPRERVGCFDVEAGGYQFRSVLDQIFEGQNARDKVFTNKVFSTPKEFKKGLLQGLFTSDGTRKFWEESYNYNGKPKKRVHKRVQLSSYSDKKLKQVLLLLNEFGIRARVSLLYLEVYTQDIPLFWDTIGFAGRKAVLNEQETEWLRRAPGLDNHIEFSTVVSVSFEPECRETIAIETESHKYVANGTITHNCGMIVTGDEDKAAVDEFISEWDEVIKARDEMGAHTSFQMNFTPLVLYSMTPLRWRERKTAKASFLGERNMGYFIEKAQARGIRTKFNGRGPGTWIEQLLMDFGPAGTDWMVGACHKGLSYGRHFNDRNREQVLEALTERGYKPLFFCEERPDDWIFPNDHIIYVTDRLKQMWLDRWHKKDFRTPLCLRTLANKEGVKCHGCKQCQSAEEIKSIIARDLTDHSSPDDVMNAFSDNRHVDSLLVVVKMRPGYDLWSKDTLSHYITSLFLRQGLVNVRDGNINAPIAEAFYGVGTNTASWTTANGQKCWFGGTWVYELQLKERGFYKDFVDLIPKVNAILKTCQVVAIHPDMKKMDPKRPDWVSYVMFSKELTANGFKDRINGWDLKSIVAVKSMGGMVDLERVVIKEIDTHNFLAVQGKGGCFIHATLPCYVNPFLEVSAITGKKYETLLDTLQVNALDHGKEIDGNCACGRHLTHSLVTNKASRLCQTCMGKVFLKKLVG